MIRVRLRHVRFFQETFGVSQSWNEIISSFVLRQMSSCECFWILLGLCDVCELSADVYYRLKGVHSPCRRSRNFLIDSARGISRGRIIKRLSFPEACVVSRSGTSRCARDDGAYGIEDANPNLVLWRRIDFPLHHRVCTPQRQHQRTTRLLPFPTRLNLGRRPRWGDESRRLLILSTGGRSRVCFGRREEGRVE